LLLTEQRLGKPDNLYKNIKKQFIHACDIHHVKVTVFKKKGFKKVRS